ncbi:MAG TPA: phage portal protein [Pyrinomonadaceae bacterium]|nr:phage portal protein [Pyrinomonadaceae bacterium]
MPPAPTVLKTPAGYDLLVPARFKSIDHLYRTQTGRGYRPRTANVFTDNRKAVSTYDWQRLVDLSRQVVSRVGILHGAIMQKNGYAVGQGWRFCYDGPDKLFKGEIEEWINEFWYPIANIRGEPYDFQTTLFLDGCAIDHDGDNVMVMRESEEGLPRLQLVAAHRIGNRQSASGGQNQGGFCLVEKGPYKGARMYNGVIVDRDGANLAFRILGDTEAEDMDVPANNAQMIFEPVWSDQGRGIPRAAVSLIEMINVEDINHFLTRQVKQDSMLGLKVDNEDGEPPTGTSIVGGDEENPRDRNTSNPDVEIEYLEGNEVQYFRSNTGGKIDILTSQRPHPNVEAFVQRLESIGLYALGWHRGLLDPASLRGANTRLIQDGARKNIAGRQNTLWKRATRAAKFAVAKAITRKSVRGTADQWWKYVNFQMPAEISVDSGNDAKADLDALRMGTTTRAILAGKNGENEERILKQRGLEVRAMITEAQEISTQTGKPFELVLSMLWQSGSGGSPPAPAPDKGKPEEEQDPEKEPDDDSSR